MSGDPRAAEIERFRQFVGERLGLHFDDTKLQHLRDALSDRMRALGHRDFDTYEGRLRGSGSEEIRALADALTVGETYFFRYWDHFRAFVEVVLPERVTARGPQRRLRILSAGCASGEEAYSLAILIRERLPVLESWKVDIVGIDVNPRAVAKAVKGRYSTWSLRDTSAEVRDRYFRSDGRELELDRAVCSMASFEERNLVEDDDAFWREGAFDAVFCRNVCMYFRPEVMRAVVSRIARALLPGGFLFLGHAETLRGMAEDFDLRHTHETFYYQRRGTIQAGAPRPAIARLEAKAAHVPLAAALLLPDTSWVAAIQRASDRVAELHGAKGSATCESSPPAPTVDTRSPPDLSTAIELLRQDRFGDAIDLLQALPEASKTAPGVQLLRAVLLTNSGGHDEAERVCHQILGADELSAGAHYVLALCREHAGDREAAIDHNKVASQLDSAFAMPRLRLGILARRSGDVESARAELRRALALLAHEDVSRILLFGGGFSRETLTELCRSELRATGAR